MDRRAQDRFQPVDIRNIPDDQLDDIIGGIAVPNPAKK
jgi:hypothetical protein